MVHLAQTAGRFLLDHFREDESLLGARSTAKEAATRYDKVADEMIIGGVRERFPEHGLLTEESGHFNPHSEWMWLVDSLDGTGNFANWNPLFAVCIAVLYRQDLVAGVVYAPALDELYVAQRGSGAFLNGVRLRTSQVNRLDQSYVLYCEGGEKDRVRTGEVLGRVYPEVVDIRKLGSAGLETAWVAAGRSDAYFTTRIEPWDVGPGVLLVQEAGGRVTDWTGAPWKVETGDFLFSNGWLHSPLMSKLDPGRMTWQ